MTERETIIKGLKYCIEANGKNCPMVCPFFKECFSVFKSTEPFYPIMRAALEHLIREAIPIDTMVIGTVNGDIEVYCCRNCRTVLTPSFHFCPNCGKGVKWDD